MTPSSVRRQSIHGGRWGRVLHAAVLAGALLLGAALHPAAALAVELNLAAVNCAKYENEVLPATLPGYRMDSIDTVMWLFGFSVAKSGERAMYGDSLTPFGFALDAECKNDPTASLLEAVTAVKSKRENPMDLTRLDCQTFESRHVALRKSDPENAATLTLWLFGYAVGISGGHVMDPDALNRFDAALEEWCSRHPRASLFDALSAPNPAVPIQRPPAPPAPKWAAPAKTSPPSR